METDTKGRYSSPLTLVLTGHLAEGVLAKFLDTKEGHSDTFNYFVRKVLIRVVLALKFLGTVSAPGELFLIRLKTRLSEIKET